jgi:uncharacterized repeat protein (TIGR03803 family)
MLTQRAAFFATLLFGCVASHAASTPSVPPAAASPDGVAASIVSVPGVIQPLMQYAPVGSPIAGPNNSLYTSFVDGFISNSYVARIAADGSSTNLHSFDLLTQDPVTGRYVNTDGNTVGGLLLANDGGLYGLTSDGGSAGYGTFFRLAPDGSFTVLTTFNFSSYGWYLNGNSGPVQGMGGDFYGLATIDNEVYVLYKLTGDGAYSMVCHWDYNTLPDGIDGPLISAGDGTFFGANRGGIVRVNPTDCSVTTIYAASTPSNLILGGDGNLYTAVNNQIIRVSPSGTGTVLATFNAVTYQKFFPAIWSCNSIMGCSWSRAHWGTVNTAMSAQGYGPYGVLWGADGNLYFSTYGQGLNAGGAHLRIAPDGSVTTLYSQPPTATSLLWETPLVQLTDGRLVHLVSSRQAPLQLVELNTQSPLSTSISFSNPTVKLWQRTTLSWSSTGAQSCQLISDIPGVAAITVATSGSKYVAVYSTDRRTPPQFTAGIQCTAADGSISNAAATLTID